MGPAKVLPAYRIQLSLRGLGLQIHALQSGSPSSEKPSQGYGRLWVDIEPPEIVAWINL